MTYFQDLLRKGIRLLRNFQPENGNLYECKKHIRLSVFLNAGPFCCLVYPLVGYLGQISVFLGLLMRNYDKVSARLTFSPKSAVFEKL